MSEEKQMIDDLIEIFDEEYNKRNLITPQFTADKLIAKGYRKQSEGEWEQQLRPYEDEIACSVCGAWFNMIDNCTEKFNYCPNCGARMKGK